MSAPQFTPGPWWLAGKATIRHGERGPESGWIADVHWRNREANARLIAAAPDLYAALQSLHDDIAEYARINNLGGFDNHSMKRARAALSLAGQQGQKT